MARRVRDALTTYREFDGGEEGELIIEYEAGSQLSYTPSRHDVDALDRALCEYSAALAPGAPRPDELVARPPNEALVLFVRMQQAANEVGSWGLAGAVPPYAKILHAMAVMRAGVGPDEVVLCELGPLSEAGYYVVLVRGRKIQVGIRLRESGVKTPIDVIDMTRLGFDPGDVVRSQLAHMTTPQWWLRALERSLVGNDN